MRVLHFSDLHGDSKAILRALKKDLKPELIVLSGDIPATHVKYMELLDSGFRKIDKQKEAEHQRKSFENQFKPALDKFDCPEIAVNGNHCFLNYTGLVSVSRFSGAHTINFNGRKIGLIVGVRPLRGEWHQELYENEFDIHISNLDRGIEILISHAPAYGVLDLSYGGENIGYRCLANKIFGSIGQEPYFRKLKAHFFGHAHVL